MPFYQFVSLDVGQSRDPSALAILEEPLWIPTSALREGEWGHELNIRVPFGEAGWVSPNHPALTLHQVSEVRAINYHEGKPSSVPLHLIHLERFPLGTSYPDVVSGVIRRVRRTRLGGAHSVLLVDETGVGRAVTDLFRMHAVYPVGLTLTGGDRPHWEGLRVRVPVRELIHQTQSVVQRGLLVAPERGLPLAKTFQKELRRFKVKQNRGKNSASERYEHWRENDTDDLVFAVSMAVWYRTHSQKLVDEVNVMAGL